MLFLRPLAMAFYGIVTLACLPAVAANIVVNGSFEGGSLGDTSTITNWTVSSPNPGLTGSHCVGAADSTVRTGSCSAFFAEGVSLGSISQTLTTTIGTNYTLTFYLNNSDATSNQFTASWGGSTVYDQSNIGVQPFTLVTISVTATSASTVLQFSGLNFLGTVFLDDVSVDAVQSTATPEPSTWLSGLVGLALVATRMRRRA